VKSSGQNWSARDVIAEALRLPDHCRHVTDPVAPIAHHGVQPQDLLDALKKLEEKSEAVMVDTSRGKRRQRSDTLILIGLVASFPLPPSERERDEVQVWIKRTIAWLLQKFGKDHVMSILEHVDENNIHLHVYVHNNGHSVKPLMVGHRERLSAIDADLPAAEVRAAYRDAMIRFQDEYFSDVCESLGLARKSPAPRPRLSRTAYIAQQRQELERREQKVSEHERALNSKAEKLNKLEVELNGFAAHLRRLEAKLLSAVQALAAKRDTLAASWKRLRAKVRAAADTALGKERNRAACEDELATKQAESELLWTDFRSKLTARLDETIDAQKPDVGENARRFMNRP